MAISRHGPIAAMVEGRGPDLACPASDGLQHAAPERVEVERVQEVPLGRAPAARVPLASRPVEAVDPHADDADAADPENDGEVIRQNGLARSVHAVDSDERGPGQSTDTLGEEPEDGVTIHGGEPDRYGPPVPTTTEIGERIARVRRRIASSAAAAGRSPADVHLLLAVKTLPNDVVRAAVLAGADLLGENRVAELVAHSAAVADLRPHVHLIGHLQSNKVTAVLHPDRPPVACVESVDTLALAERLSTRCAVLERTLDVMVQVNVSAEPTKSGVPPEQAADLAARVAALPHLQVVGFMTIGLNSPDAAAVRAGYARLRAIRDAVAVGLPQARELSMGMSGDLELAVAEGATIVRVGTAVFGARPPAR